jgi:hypothetical protein
MNTVALKLNPPAALGSMTVASGQLDAALRLLRERGRLITGIEKTRTGFLIQVSQNQFNPLTILSALETISGATVPGN